jgi:O-antigen/teichoic acid export membrane protein
LQSEQEKLTKAVNMNLKYLSLIIFPILIVMGYAAGPLATLIPKYQKWLPAILPLYFYLYNSAWASFSTSLTNLLNATGNIKVTFKLMIMWTSLTWALFPALSYKYGFLGVAYATAIVATSSIVTIYLAKKVVNFDFLSSIKTSLISSILMISFLGTLTFLPQTIPTILIGSAIAVTVFVLSAIYLEGQELVTTAKQFINHKNV